MADVILKRSKKLYVHLPGLALPAFIIRETQEELDALQKACMGFVHINIFDPTDIAERLGLLSSTAVIRSALNILNEEGLIETGEDNTVKLTLEGLKALEDEKSKEIRPEEGYLVYDVISNELLPRVIIGSRIKNNIKSEDNDLDIVGIDTAEFAGNQQIPSRTELMQSASIIIARDDFCAVDFRNLRNGQPLVESDKITGLTLSDDSRRRPVILYAAVEVRPRQTGEPKLIFHTPDLYIPSEDVYSTIINRRLYKNIEKRYPDIIQKVTRISSTHNILYFHPDLKKIGINSQEELEENVEQALAKYTDFRNYPAPWNSMEIQTEAKNAQRLEFFFQAGIGDHLDVHRAWGYVLTSLAPKFMEKGYTVLKTHEDKIPGIPGFRGGGKCLSEEAKRRVSQFGINLEPSILNHIKEAVGKPTKVLNNGKITNTLNPTDKPEIGYAIYAMTVPFMLFEPCDIPDYTEWVKSLLKAEPDFFKMADKAKENRNIVMKKNRLEFKPILNRETMGEYILRIWHALGSTAPRSL